MSRRVAVIGGGPAGLYFARLHKLRNPGDEVVVHERLNAGKQTFGFGVGLTEATMRNLAAADPETAELVRAASYAGHHLELRTPNGTVTLHGARNLAIGRAVLLDVLAAAAGRVGVELRTGSVADVSTVEADVVVAADGVRSGARAKYGSELGVSETLGRVRYVWCGTDFAVDTAFFDAVSDGGDGLFVVHAYPYAPDRSTFLIEADETTWHSAGLSDFDAVAQDNDDQSVALLEKLFAEQLRGRQLLTNRTRWSRFVTISAQRWWTDNVVLLGDAAHTAHYTLGSGTKLALEDAIALADALSTGDDLADAFTAYEGVRRPAVERFKQLAARSQAWWDSYRRRSQWGAELQALSFMTRSGNLTVADYAGEELASARAALTRLGSDVPSAAGNLDEWILTRPYEGRRLRLDSRRIAAAELAGIAVDYRCVADPDVWGEAADSLVAELTAGSVPVVLRGADEPMHLWARLDLAERLRLDGIADVGVELDAAHLPQGAAAIAAGRADFVVVR